VPKQLYAPYFDLFALARGYTKPKAMTAPAERVATTRFVNLGTYAENRPVEATVVTVLNSSHESRGLKLIGTYSRALRRDSIHELIATDEVEKKPGETVDRITYLAFAEITSGGCVIIGETLFVDGIEIGTVLGYDETHEPNHINIVIAVCKRQTGRQLNFSVGAKVRFERRATS
jgi:hypothetical protein